MLCSLINVSVTVTPARRNLDKSPRILLLVHNLYDPRTMELIQHWPTEGTGCSLILVRTLLGAQQKNKRLASSNELGWLNSEPWRHFKISTLSHCQHSPQNPLDRIRRPDWATVSGRDFTAAVLLPGRPMEWFIVGESWRDDHRNSKIYHRKVDQIGDRWMGSFCYSND